jgi:hypothetical protein
MIRFLLRGGGGVQKGCVRGAVEGGVVGCGAFCVGDERN